MKGLEGKYLIITEDYTDSEVGVWSGWRETRTGSLTTPFPKLHTIISVSYKTIFPKTTPPFL